MEYTTRELTQEEGAELTKDLQDVLKKHNAEMGVVSTIQLLKRVEVKEEGVPSPFIVKTNGDTPLTTEETPKAD